MKHYLVLTNDNRKEILPEKEIKRIKKIDAEFDGISSVSVVCEIDPQKVADNRWTTVKPDYSCLFVARDKEMTDVFTLEKNGNITKQSRLGKYVVYSLTELQADEYFVIERYKED